MGLAVPQHVEFSWTWDHRALLLSMLPQNQQGSCIGEICCKMQTLSEAQNQEIQTRTLKGFEASCTYSSSKHQETPMLPITKLLRLKAYFLPFLLVNTKCPSFSRKSQSMTKTRKDMIWRNKGSIRSRLRYDTDVGIIRQGL